MAEAEVARNELIETRRTALWVTLTPQPESAYQAATGSICAGFLEPVRRLLGLNSQLSADGVFKALRTDAEVLKSVSTREQAEKLGKRMKDKAVWLGQHDALGPRFEAAWSGSLEEKQQDNRVKAYIQAQRQRCGASPRERRGGLNASLRRAEGEAAEDAPEFGAAKEAAPSEGAAAAEAEAVSLSFLCPAALPSATPQERALGASGNAAAGAY